MIDPRVHTIIISDLHLGSPHVRCARLLAFLAAVPDGVELVLNGDTVDDPGRPLDAAGREVFDALMALSGRVRITWLAGNHDEAFVPTAHGDLAVRRSHHVPAHGLFIAHGADFDRVMPHHPWFVRTFGALHALRVRLGARPVHVAEYAKRWGVLYRRLRRSVMLNAVAYAREHGHRAVICGHVHHPERRVIDGIDYINSGAWTEDPTCYVTVGPDGIELMQWRGRGQQPGGVGSMRDGDGAGVSG